MKLEDINIKREFLEAASKTLNQEISLLDGSIWISSLIDTSKDEHNFMLPIKGLISEADDIIHEKYNIEEHIYVDLKKYENELKEYFNKNSNFIINVCNKIILNYEKIIVKFENAVNEIFFKNDPIKIYAPELAGKYKYELEIKQISNVLENIHSTEQAAELIRYMYIDMYGDCSLENRKIFENMGNQLWILIN